MKSLVHEFTHAKLATVDDGAIGASVDEVIGDGARVRWIAGEIHCA